MRDPLPLTLGLDEESQRRRSRADFELGRLYNATHSLRDPEDVLIRPARESEFENIVSLQGLVLTRREMVSGQHDLDLPYDLGRYTQVMEDTTHEPGKTSVSATLKGVARGLAGVGPETIEDDNLPWRSTEWSFATLLGPAPTPTVRPEDIPARAEQLLRWMDAVQIPVVDQFAAGTCELIALDPFSNTLDLLHVYGNLAMKKAGRLPAQVLPFTAFLTRNQVRFREAYQHVMRTGDYNEWFRFMADCVIEQTVKQVKLAQDLSRLPEELERRIMPERRDGYFRLMRMLSKFQFVNATLVANCLGLTAKRARELLHRAEKDGIVKRIGEGRRDKNYEVVEVRDLIQRYAGVVRDIEQQALGNSI